MRNMHVWPYFNSGRTVWFSDLLASGLYAYDCESEEICCKIRSDVLFCYGIFRVEALVCWNSMVFVFSEKLNGPHIVYDSLKDEIKRLDGLECERCDVVHRAIVIDKTLYLIPTEIKGYIYAINLFVWEETDDSIRLASRKVGRDIVMRTWLPKSCGHSLYIPEYEGKRVFCITNDKMKLINLDIPSAMCTIGVFEDELWVAPLHGRNIFCLTLEGKIKERIEIPYDYTRGEKNDIWEIIAKDEFVFFVHWKRPEIDIYQRNSKKIIQISGKKFKLPREGGPGDEQYYLPYVIVGDVIRFFPSRCSFLEVELSNFKYHQKDFGFPQHILEEEWNVWCRTVRKYNQSNLSNERTGAELATFIEYILEELPLQKVIKNQKDSVGMKIYQYFQEGKLFFK